MKKIFITILFITAIIVWTLAIASRSHCYTAEEYAAMTRQELLHQLLLEKIAHRETMQQLNYAWQQLNSTIAIAHYQADYIRLLHGEINRLNHLLSNRFWRGDVVWDFNLMAGTNISVSANSRIYLNNNMYGFMQAGALSPSWWQQWSSFDQYRLFGGVGVGWSW